MLLLPQTPNYYLSFVPSIIGDFSLVAHVNLCANCGHGYIAGTNATT